MENRKQTLKEKYEELNQKYDSFRKKLLKRGKIRERIVSRRFLIVVTVLGMYSLIMYRSQIAVEIGILSVIGMLVHELEGTRRGWWKYGEDSTYKICGRVPIGLVPTYFFTSVLLITYIMLRLGVIP